MHHLLHIGSISPQLFATVFGVIFLAELPDKTALAALVLATRHRGHWWPTSYRITVMR